MMQQRPRFRWGHININVRDLDRSIVFYRKLGFEVFIPAIPYLGLDRGAEAKPLPDAAATALDVRQGTRGRACILQLDDGLPKLDLTEFVDLESREPLGNRDRGIVRICLATEDLAGEVARLRSEGVEFLSEPMAAPHGLADIAVCRDPDGTLIELLQVDLGRWQAVLSGD